jgi:hypothetical protein
MRDAKQAGAFKTLEEAVAKLEGGDVIEIHGNGPFDLGSVKLGARNVVIRAATGFSPSFRPLKGASSFSVFGSLLVEGVEFNDAGTVGPVWFGCHSGQLELRRCRLFGRNDMMIHVYGKEKLRLANCLLVHYGNHRAIFFEKGLGHLEIVDSCFLGGVLVGSHSAELTVHLERSTISGQVLWGYGAGARHFGATACAFLGPLWGEKSGVPPVTWKGSGNLFQPSNLVSQDGKWHALADVSKWKNVSETGSKSAMMAAMTWRVPPGGDPATQDAKVRRFLSDFNRDHPGFGVAVKDLPLGPFAASKPAHGVKDKPGPEPGWVSLFSGKDFDGWKIHPDKKLRRGWKVEDGLLVAEQVAAKKKPGLATTLFSEQGDFENFHLRLEARISEGGKMMLFFRAPFQDSPKGQARFALLGYGAYSTGRLSGFGFAKEVAKPDEWFTLDLVVQGKEIHIKVNGETTVETADALHEPEKGHFALGVAAGADTRAEFRKIEVKRLPASPAKHGVFDALDPKTVADRYRVVVRLSDGRVGPTRAVRAQQEIVWLLPDRLCPALRGNSPAG